MTQDIKKSYKVGDVVALVSGGPLMTVTKQQNRDGTQVQCAWFVRPGPYEDYDGKCYFDNFPSSCLVYIDMNEYELDEDEEEDPGPGFRVPGRPTRVDEER